MGNRLITQVQEKSAPKRQRPEIDQKAILHFMADKIAYWAKILDHQEAELLVFLFAVIPNELYERSRDIDAAISMKHFDDIRGLFEWYELKIRHNDSRVTRGLPAIGFEQSDPEIHPKTRLQLRIFRKH